MSSQDPRAIMDLVHAARAGDRQAVAALLTALVPQVRTMVHERLARSYRRHNDWVVSMFSTGDVVQDLLMATLTELRDFRGSDVRSLTGWLAARVENQILGRLRFFRRGKRDQRRVQSLDVTDDEGRSADVVDRSPPPGVSVEAAEVWATVQEAMASLPQDERVILEHGLDPDLSWEDVARELGLPSAESARQRHKRARARLTLRLSARFPGLFEGDGGRGGER